MYQLFLWHLYLIILRDATSLLGALEGVGPENRDFLKPFQGPKMSQFSGPTPSNAPRIDVAPLNCAALRSGQFKGSKKSWPPQNVPRNGS
jgi:hypothetical protein